MAPHARRRQGQRRTVGRWLDDLIRSIEKGVVDPAAAGRGADVGARRSRRRLRHDLDLVRGL